MRRHRARRAIHVMVTILLVAAGPALAIKPIVSGDVPTAPRKLTELFVGYLLVDGGDATEESVPFWEVVYGLTEWQELTIEAPLLIVDEGGEAGRSESGLGDIVVGTKVRLLGDPSSDAGLSASLEVKLPTADEEEGLGSGEVDVDLRARGGFLAGRSVVYFNAGHTWIGEPRGVDRDNRWFYAAVWDQPLSGKVRLLAEVYGKTSADPQGEYLLAASLGVKWRLPHMQQIQGAVGKSLRKEAEGGPDPRIYLGWRIDF